MGNSFGREQRLGKKNRLSSGECRCNFSEQSSPWLQQEFIERARAAGQFPASAGSSTISAATHRAIQIRKFLTSANSVEFMVRPLEFMMTIEHANRLPSWLEYLKSMT